MNVFKNKYFWLAVSGILLLFFFTRLFNILSIPIFTDEAIYVRWAQIAKNDANWRFISLTDGKQPMFVWAAMLFMKFIQDPLLAGRSVSILAGFLSTMGIFFLAREIFQNKKIGLLAGFIYVLYPFSLVYDRMALYDSLVAMFIIWSLYFEILLVKHIRLDLALILGAIIGGGMLTKTSNDFAFVFLLLSLLLFNFKDRKWREKLFKWFTFALVSVLVAVVIYSVLRLSPFYYIINEKNAIFVYPLKEWIRHPFTYFISNLSALNNWLVTYLTVPFIVLVAASFIPHGKFSRIKSQFTKEKLFLLAAFIIPFFYLAFFGRTIYPRFILFMTMPLLVLGAYALYEMLISVKQIWFKGLLLVVFLLTFFVNDYFIITDFAKAAVPQADKGQFITGWPSGVGVNESVAYLKEQAKNQKIFVGTEGTFGLMPSALEIYLHDNPNIIIKGFWPTGDNPPKEVLEASKKMPAYFVFYQECSGCLPKRVGLAPSTWPVKVIYQVEKIEKEQYYTLYKFQ